MMTKLSKGFYLGSFVGAGSLALILYGIMPVLYVNSKNTAQLLVISLVAAAVAIYMVVVLCVLVYKAWASIQDGDTRTTPGQALLYNVFPIQGVENELYKEVDVF